MLGTAGADVIAIDINKPYNSVDILFASEINIGKLFFARKS